MNIGYARVSTDDQDLSLQLIQPEEERNFLGTNDPFHSGLLLSSISGI